MNVNINEHIFFILPLTSAGDHLDSINFRHMQRGSVSQSMRNIS